MRKYLYSSSCLFVLLFAGTHAFNQVSISGPTCVVSETVYQYTISGKWDSSSTMQVCIVGGIITDPANRNTCKPPGAPLNKILVIWNDSASDIGSLSLNSSSGNTILDVHFTELLLPGTINSTSKTQMIGYNSLPLAITCAPDSGGSCSPSYLNQWQQSADAVSWSNIPGANGQNLIINALLKQSTYYRRKVTETVSGSIAYSDVASVFLMIQLTGSTIDNADSPNSGTGINFLRNPEQESYSINNLYAKEQKEVNVEK